MKEKLKLSIFIVLWLCLAFSIKYLFSSHEVVYNCNMLIGGWHPDVPISVQERCRNHITESKK